MIWTLIGFCVLAGLAQAFDWLLAEAASAALEEGAPLIHSLLKLLPDEVPEKEEIRRMTRVANSVGVVSDHDSQWVRSILEEVGGASLQAMVHGACYHTQDFNKHTHSLARYIRATKHNCPFFFFPIYMLWL